MHEVIEQVEKILSPVYMVGGSVRDQILGHDPKDFDFATPLSPDEIEQSIRNAGRKPYCIGKKFGTIGCKVRIKDKWEYVEITTFRSEKYEEGNRKPEVEFVTNLNLDLSRRDFTMNAIAIQQEEVIDKFGGIQDIKNKILKCVGNPADRFIEDPLRMLRAGRFISQLGFFPDYKIVEDIKLLNFKILEISKERWMQEMDKLLLGDHVIKGVDFLIETKLMNFMFPELSLQSDNMWKMTKRDIINSDYDINSKWSALLKYTGTSFAQSNKYNKISCEIVLKYAQYLRWSNERKKSVYNLVRIEGGKK